MESTELLPLHITIDCPFCQKNYLVATKSLAPGQARFQCTSCQTLFGLNWFGHETQVTTHIIEKIKHTQKCFKCGFNCEEGSKECPQCGIMFVKEERVAQSIKTHVREVEIAWKKVKENFNDQSKHEEFVKLCLSHDQLAFASHQYKALLLVNPHDEMASKIQKVIQGLAEGKNELSNNYKKNNILYSLGFTKITVFACMFSMLLGISFSSLRPLVALGTSVLFFIVVLKFWASKYEV